MKKMSWLFGTVGLMLLIGVAASRALISSCAPQDVGALEAYLVGPGKEGGFSAVVVEKMWTYDNAYDQKHYFHFLTQRQDNGQVYAVSVAAQDYTSKKEGDTVYIVPFGVP